MDALLARGFEDNMNYLPKSELVFLLRIEADHSCFLETLLPILTFLVRGQLISKGLFVFFSILQKTRKTSTPVD